MKQLWRQATRYVDTPDWLDRKSWHDTIWLVVPILAILVSGPLWFFRLVDVDMSSLTWTLFAYSLIREAANYYLKNVKDTQLVLRCALLTDLAGICLLGMQWHFCQTVKDPLFLLVMVIPLIAGALIYPSPLIYTFTGISIAIVMAVAWADVASFRTALLESAIFPAWLAGKMSVGSILGAGSSTGETSAANAAAVLVAFCFSLILIAGIIDGVRRYSIGALESRSHELAIVSAERRPSFSIDRSTLAITSANKAFRDYSLSDANAKGPLAIKGPGDSETEVTTFGKLFDSIHFDEEAALRQIIAGAGGALLCHYRIGPEARVGRVRVDVLPDGQHCQLSLEDVSAENYLRHSFDLLEQAVILLAESEVVLYFNHAAARLFPALTDGVEAGAALQVEALGSPWWELGSSSRLDRNLSLNGRLYRTVCTSSRLPGQQVNISVLSVSEA